MELKHLDRNISTRWLLWTSHSNVKLLVPAKVRLLQPPLTEIVILESAALP